MSHVSPVPTPRWSVRRRPSALTVGSLLLLLFLFAPALAAGFSDRRHFWVWSELHIDYAAGFVRRGLLGEIAYRVPGLTGLSTGTFFGTVFLGMTLLEIALLFRLLRPVRVWPLVYGLLALSPGFVLF